jgi:tRNA-dihydrouridine synthase
LANWEEIAKGARIRDQINPETKFLGNGDVTSVEHGEALCEKYDLDGVMIGRGIFHNPWFFNPEHTLPSKSEKLEKLLLQTRIFERNWGGKKNLNILKRFYKIYTSDFAGAAQIRAQLMSAETFEDVYRIIRNETIL